MSSSSTNVTVKDALAALRTGYPALLDDLARGDRVLWIGAGISRDQVPAVDGLLRKVLTFLRDKIDPVKADDVHRDALEGIVHEYLPDELHAFRRDPSAWAIPGDLSHLTTSYSSILATDVGIEDSDYLLWEAVDVRETYGAPGIEPGPEHWLIAFLVHEGVLAEAVTTNWDGLIERAVRDSSMEAVPESVSVLMSQESFRDGRAPFKLYKAHGCAVLAREDSANRKYLVAKSFDINTWRDNPIFTSLVDKLRELAKNRESLMVGTSVQDSNLLGRIASATQDLRWPWDPDDPACLFAEPEITRTHREVLKVVYRDDYTPNRAAIWTISATGMFSGPLLAAATLHILMEKFRIGISYAPSFTGSSKVMAALEGGVTRVEDLIADVAGDDREKLVDLFRGGISSLVQRFFEPTIDLVDSQYRAIHGQAVKGGADAGFRHLGLPQLSVAFGLLGLGLARSHWNLGLGTGGALPRGVLELTPSFATSSGPIRIVITRDWAETNALKSTDLWVSDLGDVLVLQALGERPTTVSRGPGGGLGSGRRVASRARRVTWMSSLEPFAGDADDLMDAFRAEVSA